MAAAIVLAGPLCFRLVAVCKLRRCCNGIMFLVLKHVYIRAVCDVWTCLCCVFAIDPIGVNLDDAEGIARVCLKRASGAPD